MLMPLLLLLLLLLVLLLLVPNCCGVLMLKDLSRSPPLVALRTLPPLPTLAKDDAGGSVTFGLATLTTAPPVGGDDEDNAVIELATRRDAAIGLIATAAGRGTSALHRTITRVVLSLMRALQFTIFRKSVREYIYIDLIHGARY